MRYSSATPIVSMKISTKVDENPAVEAIVVAGATVTSLTFINAQGVTEELTSGTILGFRLGNQANPGYQDSVLDGVPMYRQDPNGGGFLGLAEELFDVEKVVVSVPGEEEDDPATLRVIDVASITAIETVDPEPDEEENGD